MPNTGRMAARTADSNATAVATAFPALPPGGYHPTAARPQPHILKNWLKSIGTGTLNRPGTKKPGIHGEGTAIEVYGAGRYFTLTGHRLEGSPAEVRQREKQFRAVLASLIPEPPDEGEARPQVSGLSKVTAEQVIDNKLLSWPESQKALGGRSVRL